MKTENVAESHQADIPYTFPAGHETRLSWLEPGPVLNAHAWPLPVYYISEDFIEFTVQVHLVIIASRSCVLVSRGQTCLPCSQHKSWVVGGARPGCTMYG